MRKICLIGMGPGGLKYLTAQAIAALRKVDVFFLLEKQGRGKEALGDTRHRVLDLYRGPGAYRVVTAESPPRARAQDDYLDVVADWHARKAEIFAALFDEHLAEGQTGGVLVWGDPALYDSSIAILRRVQAQYPGRFEVEVTPAVSSLNLLAARHAIPLHEIGGDLLVTTARRLLAGAAKDHESVAVMLDSNAAFAQIAPEDFDIYWGAYLGTEHEVLASGPLGEIGPALAETVRREKQRLGWILDIYLLRRRHVTEPAS
ncbi:precorrin-6A synthase (deacetylating) [Rhodoblastus sphagnicola]|uniref:Precorrin-6A synthase [deacetylating] n=1 Tax=Rhodoblastus sphagnicola TaxID=333368 RepID=A0A2S6NDB4_9HYPH|nr:precorrin-6A synthase (deacetylating) [Rhodoblastus sphagnicola]MBB4201043.1 precorrin-6A synthase [Rhodoblastus sphagnicola]PPQ32635.1 precorrin-6A synthase (deacetylating) [Rhodoblastus sphagnicola]